MQHNFRRAHSPSAANMIIIIMVGILIDLHLGVFSTKCPSRRNSVLKLRIMWAKLYALRSHSCLLQMIFETSF